jgi:hypothetical protein
LEAFGDFAWRNGVLQRLVLDSHSGPLQFKSFSGNFEFQRGVLALSKSQMATPAGLYLVGGTVSLDRQLGLTLRNGKHSYDLSGSLDTPKVTPAAKTQAALQ